ncbi:hypothetical protein Tco_0201841 [Tanacetum coccineum]
MKEITSSPLPAPILVKSKVNVYDRNQELPSSKHIETQSAPEISTTNIPSAFLYMSKHSTEQADSKPRSNTKKIRILPAKKENKEGKKNYVEAQELQNGRDKNDYLPAGFNKPARRKFIRMLIDLKYGNKVPSTQSMLGLTLSKKEGIDFIKESFAPVAWIEGIRISLLPMWQPRTMIINTRGWMSKNRLLLFSECDSSEEDLDHCGCPRLQEEVNDRKCLAFIEKTWLAGHQSSKKKCTAYIKLTENTMAEQNVPAQPPTRTDEQIVPRSQWLTIGKSNLLFNAQKIQKNPIFQISVDILSNTNFFQAFTASANVPAIYLQQFWKTMSYNEKTGVYSCQVDEQWFDLSADLLRKALAITPVNPAHPFELPPSGNTVIDFVNELGYPEPVEIVSNIRVNYVYQPWRAILSLINQCLTGKTSGSDKPRHPVLQMLWGIVTQTNVDHAELIWEEFTQGIQTFFSHKASHNASLKNPKKKVTPLLIPYGRFSKFVPKGELVEVFGMAIPDPLITEAIQQSSYYPKYLEMVAENTKKTPQEIPPPTKNPFKRKLPQKVRKGKPTFRLVDEDDEAQQESIPQEEEKGEGEGDDADLERAIKLSLDPAFLPHGRAPVGGVTIRDPVSETTSKLHKKISTDQFILVRRDQTPPDSTTGPSSQPDDDTSDKVIHESSSTSDSERTESETEAAAPKGDKDQDDVDTSTVTSGVSIPVSNPEQAHEALAGPDPEPMKEDQTGSDSRNLHVSLVRPNPEHMDDEFLATAYPKVHENLKLITDERVFDDKPESHSGSMSSMKNLDDTFNFGDQFLHDKPTEDDQEKSKVREESDSTIPDSSHQTVTSTPPVIAPFTEVSSSKPSLLVTPPPINTEATTITTSLPEITPFISFQLRVARLEQEMSEVKKTDHSTDVLASIRSQVPTAVDNYLGTKLDDALLKVLERHTADLIEKYSVLPGPESVKNQESEKSPKEIIRAKKEQDEEKQDSTYSIRSTDKVDLEEFDLKSALFSHMNKKKSANKNTANYHLYHALMEALIADEDAMDKEVADKVKDHKRKHDSDDDEDDDDDEGPSAGSNQGRSTKKRRSDSARMALTSTGWQITDTREAGVDSSMHKSDPESEHSEQSSDDISMQDEGNDSDMEDTDNAHIPKVSTTTWFKSIPESERPATPEPELTIPPNDFPEPEKKKKTKESNWANAYATTYKVPEENKLQRKTYDIGSFIKWFCRRTGKKKLCKADLEGPVFNLVKAFHKNSVFFQYQMDECHKLLTNKVDLSDKERKIALSISKLKATRYLDFGLEELVPSLWVESEREYDISAVYGITHWWFRRKEFYINKHSESSDREAVRSQMRIPSMISVKVFEKYGYNYLREIILRRADYQEYKILEKDFKNLHPNDFEDLFLLNIQEKLNHLPKTDKTILHTAVNMWIRNLVIRNCMGDLQLGIESYQTKINLERPNWDAADYYFKEDDTIVPKPRAVVYRDRNDQRKLMRLNELYKFSDGTLIRVMEKLDQMVKDFHLYEYNKGMETRKRVKDDKEKKQRLHHRNREKDYQNRRIYRSLESFVGGRIRED